MAIRTVVEAAILKKYCGEIGRLGMGDRIVALAKDIVANSDDYVHIMRVAGKIRAITTGAQCDLYFGEKVSLGFTDMVYEAKRKIKQL